MNDMRDGSGQGGSMNRGGYQRETVGHGPEESRSKPASGSVESMFDRILSDPEVGDHAPVATPGRGPYDDLWQLSMADPITGSANQMLLLDRLNQALKRRQRNRNLVVLFHLDIANLHDIIDEFGYGSEREVLHEVTRRLMSALRTEDTVGRVGRCDFVALVTLESDRAAAMLARRILTTVTRPVIVEHSAISLAVNLGIAVASDGESPEELLAKAHEAALVNPYRH
jgi:diguanylate cyclase (GGDEF)-like protein